MLSTRNAVFASLTASLLVSAAPAPAAAADTVPGDRWEITSQMSMEGVPMAFPANKVKVCTPKTWTAPPGGADDRMKCTSSNFRLDAGGKALWEVTCAGPPAMTGTGEITRESDAAWSGAIKLTSSEGTMNMTLSGHKLEDCEAKP